MKSTPFQNVSHAQPCKICSKTDWCSYAEEHGEVVVAGCRREIDSRYPTRSKTDVNGVQLHLHWLKGKPGDPVPETYFRLQEPRGDHERTDITTINAVYSDLLSFLPLDQEDRAGLHGRGYSDEDIETFGFKSWPSSPKLRAHVLSNLHVRYGDALLTVPGFRFEGKKAAEDLTFDQNGAAIVEEPELEMVGGPGYFLPITDEEGRLCALQLRPRDGKYIAFSSPIGGAGAGLHVHVPKGFQVKDSSVLVTEGVHKANLASKRLGRLVLGLPSIAMIDLAHPLFGQLSVKVVELAYDADTREKPTTAAPLRRAAHRLAQQGFDVRVWTWPSAAGKGIDDVLTRQDFSLEPDERDGEKAITVLKDRALWTWIKDVCRAAKLPKDPIQDALLEARARIANLIGNVANDPSIAFRSENIEAVAALEKNSAETIGLFDKFKALLEGKFTAWHDKVVESQKVLAKKKLIVKAQANDQQIFQTASHTEIGSKIISSFAFDHQGKSDPKYARYANGYLHIYDHNTGTWKPIERAKLASLVQGWDRHPVLSTGKGFKADYGPISGGIKCAYDRVEEKSFFADAPQGLPFANGFVRVKDGQIVLSRHAADDRALHAYPFNYEPSGEPVEWLRALSELWEGDEDQAEKVAYLQEFMGAALMGDSPRWQKATLLWGPSSQNGKSSLNAAIRSIFLPGMVASIQPEHFKEKFRLAELSGKLANFVDELNGQYLDDSDLIKWIVTAKTPITAERKNQDPFEFLPRAAHFWNCNNLPSADEMGEAFFRRFTILFFNRRFIGADDKKNYLEGIAEKERALIVNWSLRGYARLLKNQGYTIPKSSAEHGEAWKRKADQVARFVDNCLVVSDNPKADENRLLKLDALYNLYKGWAANEGSQKFPMAKEKLGDRLKALGYEYRTSKMRAYKLTVRPLEVPEDLDGEWAAQILANAAEDKPAPTPPATLTQDEDIIEAPCVPRDDDPAFVIITIDGIGTMQRIEDLGQAYRGSHVLIVRDGGGFRFWRPSAA